MESEPKTLDPHYNMGRRESQILQSIFEGLTRYDPHTLKSIPGVAHSWNISADGLVYTFHLRSNAKWSDGKPVTARDFFNSWEHLLSPSTKAPYAALLFDVAGAQEYAEGKQTDPLALGLKVKGTRVFEVTLKNPLPYFLGLTSFTPLLPVRRNTSGNNVLSVSNGAFYLASQDPEKGIFLKPNPYYWGRHDVRLAGVQFRPFGNFDTALKLYGRTGIDVMADLPPEKVAMLRFRSDFQSAPLFRTEYFTLNCTRPPLDKKEVRQALAYVLNRKFIVEEVLKRGDLPFGLFVPPGLPDYQNPENPQTFDPQKAKSLLQKAGIDLSKLKTGLQINFNAAPDRRLVAQAAGKMWSETLGLPIRYQEDEWAEYLAKRSKMDFDLLWGGWYGDYLDPKTFLDLFLSEGRQNVSGWKNTKYDKLMEKADKVETKKERMEFFQQAESLLLEEAAVIPILVKTKTYLVQPYVRGYHPNLLDIHPMRDVYSVRR